MAGMERITDPLWGDEWVSDDGKTFFSKHPGVTGWYAGLPREKVGDAEYLKKHSARREW